MVHDPCNPLPDDRIPQGLHAHAARPAPGHGKVLALQSHVVTTIPQRLIGCDHRLPPGHDSWRLKSVQVPPTVDIPRATLPRSPAVVVATLPSYYPPVSSFAGIPDGSPPELQMPEPASAAMFLFAVLVVWSARRFNPQHWTFPTLTWPGFEAAPKARHRHRCRSIAQYHAIQMKAY